MSNSKQNLKHPFLPRTLVSAMYCLGVMGLNITPVVGVQNAQAATKDSANAVINQTSTKKIYKTQVQAKADATEVVLQFNAFPPKPTITQVLVGGTPRILVDFGNVEFADTVNDNSIVTPELKRYRIYRNADNHVILEADANKISRFDSSTDKGTFVLRLLANNTEAKPVITQPAIKELSDLLIMQNSEGVSGARVKLPSVDDAVNVAKTNNRLTVTFKNAIFNSATSKETYIDNSSAVIDSARSYNADGVGILEFTAQAPFDYQINRDGNVLSLEFSRHQAAPASQSNNKPLPLKNRGKLVSMDFQDVDTRRILQVLASYTGTNIVASDSVKSTISIKLDQVPWEQALRVILTSANLVQRADGDVILVSPADEFARREAELLKLESQSTALVPTETSYIQLNYAVASDIATLIKNTSTKNSANANENTALTKEQLDVNVGSAGSLLSPRGSVAVDNRTNTIIVNDTPQKIRLIQSLVKKLDIPVRQVMVEAKIVHANDDFSKALGIRWGLNRSSNPLISNNIEGVVNSAKSPAVSSGTSAGVPIALDLASSVTSKAISGIAFGLINTSSTLLALQLAALQSDGRGEVLSAPRVLTGDKQVAKIRSGSKVPYQSTSDNAGTTTTFQDAVLELNVTPSITPDGNVQMKLSISKDSLGILTSAGYVINTNSLDTNVLVGSGETVVLGGFYENTRTSDTSKVPLLGDAPAVGKLFRSQRDENKKQELLIFITPQIIDPQAVVK